MTPFLYTLFSDKPDDDYILIWKINRDNEKSSAWFKNIDEAAAYAQKFKSEDVYIGCGVSPKNFGTYKRCKADNIAGIPGLWLDIDLDSKDPKIHKKSNLPHDEKDIAQIMALIPYKPTIAINSGHGRQYWWKFKEFWSFDSNEEREKAALLALKFTRTVQHVVRQVGFDIDMTFDLARVFRVPDTMNNKSNPVLVRMLQINDYYYEPSDFDDFLVTVEISEPAIKPRKVTPNTTLKHEKFVIKPDAEPPFDKFQALMEAEPKFKKSWEGKRKDFTDTSPSSYDFSLASFAFYADWTWQEVVDLLIAFRRKHDFEKKLRVDYYERTLTKAEETVNVNKAKDNIDDIMMNINNSLDRDNEDVRQDLSENLSRLIGIPITNIIKLVMDEPEYRLETPVANVNLGKVDGIIDQNNFRKSIAKATDYVMPRMKAARWDQVAQALLKASKKIDMGIEGTVAGMMRIWFQGYFMSGITVLNDIDEASMSNYPFLYNEQVCIFSEAFRQYVRIHHSEIVSGRQMGIYYREYGCTNININVNVGKKNHTTRSAWMLPQDDPALKFATCQWTDKEEKGNGNGSQQRGEYVS